MYVRVAEGAILLPVSLLAVIGLWAVATSIGEPHLRVDLVAVAVGGALGLASLWIALFCTPSDYDRRPVLAGLVFTGLLVGGAVALTFFGLEFADLALAVPPLLVAVHHLLVISLVFWKRCVSRRLAAACRSLPRRPS